MDVKALVNVGLEAIEKEAPGTRVIVIVVQHDVAQHDHAVGARGISQRDTARVLEIAAGELRAGLVPRLVTS